MSRYDSPDATRDFLRKVRVATVKDENTRPVTASSTANQSTSGNGAKTPVQGSPKTPRRLSPHAQTVEVDPSTSASRLEVYVAGARLPSNGNGSISPTAEGESKPWSPTLGEGSIRASISEVHRNHSAVLEDKSNMLDKDYSNPRHTPTQIELLGHTKDNSSYLDNVVARHKIAVNAQARSESQTSSSASHASVENQTGATLHQDSNEVLLEDSYATGSGESARAEDLCVYPVSGESVLTDDPSKGSQTLVSQPANTSLSSPPQVAGHGPVKITENSNESSGSLSDLSFFSPQHLSQDDGALEQASHVLASKIAHVKVETEGEQALVGGNDIDADSTDRQHAVYFNTWGTPGSRTRPKSQIRTITLSGLPPNADYTFVASLIHGGTIQSIVLSSTSKTAHVLFTDGPACNQYFEKYPNGISIKHKGRSLMIFVDKGKNVDVMSSILEGHLSAGASRVVRAANVDEDWSMRALHRIAEGEKHQRKVEAIVDSFRNEVRTVVFRFADIADAVTFRYTLQRCKDWEFTDIGFMSDPCEKATGIHFD